LRTTVPGCGLRLKSDLPNNELRNAKSTAPDFGKTVIRRLTGLSGRPDALSLTKAIVLLDLSVELMLNNIVLNLDPNFTVNETKGSEDISRKTLWGNAARAVRATNKGSLPEAREIANLHALRNLVQHSGNQPSQSETERYFAAIRVMFSTVFENVYGLDFSRFQIWDLVANNDLREWLRDSEVALTKGHPEICIAGCNHAHDLIIGAIRRFTKLRRFRSSVSFHRPRLDQHMVFRIKRLEK